MSSVILFKTGNRVLILIFTAIVRSLVRCLLHRAWSEMDISYIFTHDPLWAVTHTAWSLSVAISLCCVLRLKEDLISMFVKNRSHTAGFLTLLVVHAL